MSALADTPVTVPRRSTRSSVSVDVCPGRHSGVSPHGNISPSSTVADQDRPSTAICFSVSPNLFSSSCRTFFYVERCVQIDRISRILVNHLLEWLNATAPLANNFPGNHLEVSRGKMKDRR
jgi:hypothetical protein